MEFKGFLDKMRDIQALILEYLDDEEDGLASYNDLVQKIDDTKIRENKEELVIFFNLIVQISGNRRRSTGFFDKIIHILQYFKNDYRNIFTNMEIFNIFKKNKRILLYFIDEKILNIDDAIILKIKNKKNDAKTANFIHYFPEIDSKIEGKSIEFILKELPENFEELRRNGENDSPICELIRKDLVTEFITFINKTNFSLLTTINPSIYETNSLLIKESPTLIEYAAFYGSLQIFKYLFMNAAEMNQSLWKYTIHGSNPELIHFLEENKVKLQDNYYSECLIEAFKCHLNEIDRYYIDNFIPERFVSNYKYYSLEYYNFNYIEPEFINECILSILIKYDYDLFVKSILKNKEVNINYKSISSIIYFLFNFINLKF